ncbi:hypothetical protein AA309_20830 [Microvirga vignae]|uniref:Uncharacterized protein n=1 Tax=Microvirga vignae TaxID=1225564 RepID=A0A0H1RFF7_9HYPH|nr:hypothetical protein [Microvirga vignae]KLK91307.1 hypothetical protein AA309_20830 [Microvirga vignae]
MPDLHGLILRSNPHVLATGRLIKGLYYSNASTGPHAMAAFYMACDHMLEQKPFLIMDLRSSRYFLDGNRDSCVDETGTLPVPEIDPANFLPAVDGAEELCNENPIGQRQLNNLIAVR